MKNYLWIYVLAAVALRCTPKPEPLAFGQDACHTCKMTLMDNKFGCELVTKKGKVYKFDDMNCMLNFYHSGYEDPQNFEFALVIDFANPGKLLDARQSWYVKSETIRSPMGSGIAAFETEEVLQNHNQQWKGILMSWGEVNTQFK